MPRILYIQYTDPTAYPPLQHSASLLAAGGWEVLFLGRRSAGHPALAWPPHPRVRLRFLGRATGGWRQKFHYLAYCAWVVFWALRWRPGWIYASDLWAAPPGQVLRWLGYKVLFHEHDVPQVAAPSRAVRVALAARRRLARDADAVVVPNRARAEWLARDTGRAPERIFCVWNCPRLEEVRPARSGRPSGPLGVTYHGNLGPELLPLALVEALAQVPDARLRVFGYTTAGQAAFPDALLALARRLGVADRVEFRGAAPRHELMRAHEECDIGLALFPKQGANASLETLAGASNKVFDYLACGLAVLVVDRPEWRSLLVEPGYALACDPHDVGSIRAALQWGCDHRQQLAQMGERGRQRVLEGWNYDRAFAPVMRALADG